jgi:hypothetical protein
MIDKTKEVNDRTLAMNPLKQNPEFGEIVQLIDAARQKSYQAVNTQLIGLYWQVGAYICHLREQLKAISNNALNH